jgi:photosystem II stability/assembly factor-like uncharacterized protein
MNRIIYLFLTACVTFVFSTSLHAQYTWEHFGPEGYGSKTRSIIFDADGNLLAGSSGGGLWKSVNEGLSWFKVESYTGNPNITSMVRDGSTIYISTGETAFEPYILVDQNPRTYNPASPSGAFGAMGLPGGGIYVSTNNGDDWSNDNASTKDYPTLNYDGPMLSIQKIVLSDNGRLFIAAREGLFYSDDKLSTVQLVNGPDYLQSATIFDIEVAGDRVFAGTKDSLYVSNNGGDSFSSVVNENLFSNGTLSFIRIEIEIADVNPDVVYVAGSSNKLEGIWKSEDGGATWRRFAPKGSPGFAPLGTNSLDAFVLQVKPGTEEGLIVSGQNWFTLTEEDGWVQTAQHTNPNALARNYVPSPIYSITFDPDNPKTLYIGTGTRIFRSDDLGQTFYQRTKGYGSTNTFSVTSVGLEGRESIIAGTADDGFIMNNNWWKDPYDASTNPSGPPSVKGFGGISNSNLGTAQASYLYPGSMIIQGSDWGVLRSDGSFGGTFERFYGVPLNTDDFGRVFPLTGVDSTQGPWFVDRTGRGQEPGGLVDNLRFPRGGFSFHTPFVLDEYIPDSMITQPGDDINAAVGRDELQTLPHYVFMAASDHIWLCHFALGDTSGLLPRWDRISNDVLDNDEYYTAIEVSGDENHTIYAGTSKGRLVRVSGSTDFETFDASRTEFVVDLTGITPSPVINNMAGRWITDIAADPTNPDRLAITFGGYGGTPLPNNPPASYVWLVENASTAPSYFLYRTAPREPAYSCEFVEEEDGKVKLLIGMETGVYSTDGFNTPMPPNPIVPGVFTRETPAAFGNQPVYDIFVRRYRSVVRDEETSDFVLYNDNTIFFASRGHGIWATYDARFAQRDGDNTETSIEISALDAVFYPNPTSDMGSLRIDLIESASVSAQLFAVDGRRVQTFVKENLDAGRHTFSIETSNLNPGVYFMEVMAKGATKEIHETIKVVISQ